MNTTCAMAPAATTTHTTAKPSSLHLFLSNATPTKTTTNIVQNIYIYIFLKSMKSPGLLQILLHCHQLHVHAPSTKTNKHMECVQPNTPVKIVSELHNPSILISNFCKTKLDLSYLLALHWSFHPFYFQVFLTFSFQLIKKLCYDYNI